ncbi:MAG: 50S ribosomal protein L10 [Candidatus Peribacteraceae bacterium]|nr:50S ribosomal protein L10 [Candidatus Peribacteraceae bacterium]MBP9850474.1 50S ribosomal protein L10 [Candidatus Peribacteraceae bacterium]
MALTRTQKEDQVKVLTDKMKNASSVIFTHYLGLTVADITALRSHLRKEEAEMQVAKKSLIQLAAKNANAPEIEDSVIPGGVACIFSFKEPTAGAAITHKFGKDHPQIKLVGGIFSGKILSAEEASTMATIPSKLQLLGMFMSMCNAPLTQFASAIGSPLTGFARALSEIAKKKESEAPTPVVAEAAPIAVVAETPAEPPAPAPATAA